mgnify:FL=1|jgi:hypothetical protein
MVVVAMLMAGTCSHGEALMLNAPRFLDYSMRAFAVGRNTGAHAL